MFFYPVEPKTLQQLKKQSNPSMVPGQSEAVPWVLYDTATYADNATTDLDFFNTARATRRATNLPSPGQLPEPQFFEIFGWFLTPIIGASATGWEDLSLLLMGNGAGTDAGPPTWSFSLADKEYGPFPMFQLQSLGGVGGFGLSLGDTTDGHLTVADSGRIGNGAWWDGAVTIPPQQNFRVTLRWDSAVDISGDILLQVAAVGVLHRRIV